MLAEATINRRVPFESRALFRYAGGPSADYIRTYILDIAESPPADGFEVSRAALSS